MYGVSSYRTLVSSADLWQLPLVCIFIYAISFWWINGKTSNTTIKTYAIAALSLRLLSAILALIMYQYYYGYGDTYGYFYCGRQIWTAIWEAPSAGLELLFQSPENYSALAKHYASHPHFSSSSSRFIAQVIGVISLFTFKSYLTTSFILSFLSFIGCWKIYLVFIRLFPQLYRPLALAILFIPSVVFWGIGLMKESLLLFGMGLLVEGLFMLFYAEEKKGKNLLYFLLGALILFKVKPYILIFSLFAFIPVAINRLAHFLNGPFFRFFSKLSMYVLIFFVGFLSLLLLGNILKIYQPEKALQYMSVVQKSQILANQKMGGSAYDLGVLEPNFTSLGVKSFAAINVTLFRPYPWESRKIINIPTMMESLLCFLITLFVLIKVGPFECIRRGIKNPIILYCLIFSFSVGIIVGLFAFNFGTLARYKIPVLPFYFVALILLYYSPTINTNPQSNKLLYSS